MKIELQSLMEKCSQNLDEYRSALAIINEAKMDSGS